MRVHVYTGEGPTMTILVEPAVGKGRPPVLVRGITRQNVKAAIEPIIKQMRRPKGEGPEQPG